ncbi:MAG: DUF3307 domain-containing protein [candidate division KSB1 bacterium]|nr:DUF3307 domain-containing protein [candidate division KSB1 bacterium]MDZ7335878.1 DUF3307 domain-containing protein [candidate division KSB1 bacterium]MDZ7356674.1 DUF3307 domain-containing protein [candidate division KSB1 bacterium]MDZ7398551.1 DUF3307 domain-containing protein [candidate division KSB1 bacterium]
MNLFWLLLLAHFIADFPLQSDKIFALKSKYKWGLLPHIFISLITNIIIAFPFLEFANFRLAILFLFGIHFILDWMKLVLTRNVLNDSVFVFLVDQILHIFFIWLTCYHLFHIPSPQIANRFVADYYLNRKVIITLTGLVVSMFGGGVIIYYVKKFIHQLTQPTAEQSIIFPNANKRRIGYIERFFSTLGMIFGGWFFFLIPVAFIPRLILHGRASRQLLMINLIASLSISMAIGLSVRLLW